MRMTALDALLAQEKMDKSKGKLKGQQQEPCASEKYDGPERDLHDKAIQWCNEQWPRWQYCHNRMDKRSTAGVGDMDFVVFGPFPLCVLVEFKRKGKKRSKEQNIHATLMRALGWEVALAYSWDEFLVAVAAAKAKFMEVVDNEVKKSSKKS